MKFASHGSKHRLNRKFRKKWISIIPLVRDHRVLFIYLFILNSGCTSPFLWDEEACSPRKSAQVLRPQAHGSCSPCLQPLPLRTHLGGAPFYSTAPSPHFFFSEVNWNWGKCYLSISDWCFICYHEKIFFWRLRSFVYLWTLFSSLLLTLCLNFFFPCY